MKVLKANKQQFEFLHKYSNKGVRIEFRKDGNYNRVCSVANKTNAVLKGVFYILEQLEVVDFVRPINLSELPDEDKRYIEVKPAGDTGNSRAKWISRELYNIEYPKDVYDSNSYAFDIVEHDGKYYLLIDPNCRFYPHSQADLKDLIVVMYGTVSNEEIKALEAFILSAESFVFSQIIPQDHAILTHSEIF
jgi:hypothetical protein